MADDEDEPSAQAYETTGFVGIVIFTSIIVINTLAFRHRAKYSPFFIAFYSFISILCVLELPRYLLMMLNGEYKSQGGYSLHIMASYLFFLCLTMIARLWSTFVELGPIETKVYSKVSLGLCNALFLALVLISIAVCLLADSLDEFFDSSTYFALTIGELVVNFIYTSCLVLRFHLYANNASTKVTKNSGRIVSKDNDLSQGFKQVMYKVLFSFSFLVACSLIRLGMLLVRFQDNFMDTVFTVYSTAWFIWTDFIPRGLACLTLVFLMFYKPIKLQIPTFSTRDKTASGEDTGQEGGSNSSRPNYRDYVEEEGDQYEIDNSTDNPIRALSTNYGRRRSSIEMKASSITTPALMTDFFRPSEDFDLELNKAMDST